MLPYTQNSLSKLEGLMQTLGYKIRYERGNFRSGTCILQEENVLVVNRFSDIEVKVKSMIQIIQGLEVSEKVVFNDKEQKLFNSLYQIRLDL